MIDQLTSSRFLTVTIAIDIPLLASADTLELGNPVIMGFLLLVVSPVVAYGFLKLTGNLPDAQ
jgi:hypothetical protein